MNRRAIGLLGLAMVFCWSTFSVAQDEERRGRGQRGPGGAQRGPGGPGFGGPGFRGGMMGGGGALELVALLQREEVRKEVEMTDETAAALREAGPDMRAIFQASEGERAAKLKEANEKAKEMLDEALSPEHQKRLMGLLVQLNGYRAATNDVIAAEVGIDEATVKKVEEAVRKSDEGRREKMRELFQPDDGPGNFDREKMRAMMEEAQAESEKAVKDVLTAEQVKALDELKGEKFEFADRGFGGFGRGPGGGGPPGAGGRPGGGRPQGGGGRPDRGSRPE